MKHPLTSKERRGLAAVAAAALLCVAGGVLVRTCGHASSPEIRVESSEKSEKSGNSESSESSGKTKTKNQKKKKSSKTKKTPVKDRSHLDEELD